MTKYEEQSEVLKQPLGSSPTQDTERLKENFQNINYARMMNG